MKQHRSVAAMAAGLALVLGACGGAGDDADGGASATNSDAGPPAAPALSEARTATGELTVCAGKDTAGDQKQLIERFNARYEEQGLHAELLEFPESADEQRNQFVQRQEARSPECDVFKADTVFMAELVAQDWLYDLSSYVEGRADDFIASTLETVEVGGRAFGVPYDTDAGLLFYRTDRVRSRRRPGSSCTRRRSRRVASCSRARRTRGSRATSWSWRSRRAVKSSPRTARAR